MKQKDDFTIIDRLLLSNFPLTSYYPAKAKDKREALRVFERCGEQASIDYLKTRIGAKSPIKQLASKYLPNAKFLNSTLKVAARKLKEQGEQKALEYLQANVSEDSYDLKSPVKCEIVATSKKLEDFAIYNASRDIQCYIYNLSKDEFLSCVPGTSKESHQKWFSAHSALKQYETLGVQCLNLIFSNAISTYKGVEKKVAEANAKKIKKIEERKARGLVVEEFEPKKVYGEDNKLLEVPGINPVIYCYQQISPKVYVSGQVDWAANSSELQIYRGDIEGYKQYDRKPDDPIVTLVTQKSRLEISDGSPGHIPEKDKDTLTLNKHRRLHKYWSSEVEKSKNAILVVIRMFDGWVLVDLRGLLRQCRYRKLIAPNQKITVKELLSMVTGDPVVDVERKVCRFIFKPEIIRVKKKNTIKASKKVAENLAKQQTTLLSIDLGVTNVVAASVYSVVDGKMERLMEPFALTDEQKDNFTRCDEKRDRINANIRKEAIAFLTLEEQAEIRKLDTFGPEEAKIAICKKLGIDDVSSVPWDSMGANTTILSDIYLANGGDLEKVYFTPKPKKNGKGKKVPDPIKSKDFYWSRKYRPRLSTETREHLNEKIWELQRANKDYQKLAIRKKELSRQVVNYILAKVENRTQCGKVIIALEDIDVKMFHRKDARISGWDGFFVAKSSKQWLIKEMHKAFSDLSQNRGYIVIEVRPAYTSQTCPKCGYCHRDNRDKNNREKFSCKKCGFTAHADFDVATYNIAKVAVTGERLKGPEKKNKKISSKEVSSGYMLQELPSLLEI